MKAARLPHSQSTKTSPAGRTGRCKLWFSFRLNQEKRLKIHNAPTSALQFISQVIPPCLRRFTASAELPITAAGWNIIFYRLP
jgi:hypothetical protein